jgi:hypothetical protein
MYVMTLLSNAQKCLRVIFLLTLALHSGYHSQAQKKEEELEVYEDWRLKKEKDGIQIFTRWIEAEEGRKARQMHAMMKVKASLHAAVISILDDEEVRTWLNRAKEYYHFDQKDEFHWYAYTQFSIPWPLDNQDLITLNTLSQDEKTKKILVTLEGRPDYRDEEKGVQRIPHFDGSWEFTPMPDGTIQVDYFIFTKTKPVLPRWIIDPIVEYGLWRTFSEMQEVILANEDNKLKLSFISE